jgi:hypothetical protein
MATPCYNEWVTIDYALSLYKTKWPVGAEVSVASCMGCSCGKALDNFAKTAIDKKFDFLVVACSDSGWNSDAVCKLIADDKDVVSGWSRSRFRPFEVKAFTGIDRENVLFSFRKGIGTGIEKVYSVAGELQVYKVSIFSKMKYPWFQGILRPTGEPTTDDFNFGCRAYDAGIEIFLDWDVSLGHIASGLKTDKNGLRAQ